jgi:hypothetical protein
MISDELQVGSLFLMRGMFIKRTWLISIIVSDDGDYVTILCSRGLRKFSKLWLKELDEFNRLKLQW